MIYNFLPVTVHGADRVDHAVSLVKQRRVAHSCVEVAVVKQIVLVAL